MQVLYSSFSANDDFNYSIYFQSICVLKFISRIISDVSLVNRGSGLTSAASGETPKIWRNLISHLTFIHSQTSCFSTYNSNCVATISCPFCSIMSGNLAGVVARRGAKSVFRVSSARSTLISRSSNSRIAPQALRTISTARCDLPIATYTSAQRIQSTSSQQQRRTYSSENAAPVFKQIGFDDVRNPFQNPSCYSTHLILD